MGKQSDHEDWCPKSKVYLNKRVYNAGFLLNDETGEVRVHLSESLLFDKTIENETDIYISQSYDREGRKYPQHEQGKITISAMIKKMNMLTFKHVAFYRRNNEILYPETSTMIKKMYWAEKRTWIDIKKKYIADLNRQNDGIEFVYKELFEIPKYKTGERITRVLIKGKNDEIREVPVYTQKLDKALKEYDNTYATNDLSNRNIIMAGFRNKYAIYNLRFLLVNNYGLFCESNYEV